MLKIFRFINFTINIITVRSFFLLFFFLKKYISLIITIQENEGSNIYRVSLIMISSRRIIPILMSIVERKKKSWKKQCVLKKNNTPFVMKLLSIQFLCEKIILNYRSTNLKKKKKKRKSYREKIGWKEKVQIGRPWFTMYFSVVTKSFQRYNSIRIWFQVHQKYRIKSTLKIKIFHRTNCSFKIENTIIIYRG